MILPDSIALMLRNGQAKLINGFLSLIRESDDNSIITWRMNIRVKLSSSEGLGVNGQQREKAISLWKAVCEITDRGNNAEVKRKKDGSFTVYEVKKNIVTV